MLPDYAARGGECGSQGSARAVARRRVRTPFAFCAAPGPYQPRMPPAAERAWPVVAAVALPRAYAAFTLIALALHGWNPFWFVWIGERYGEPRSERAYRLRRPVRLLHRARRLGSDRRISTTRPIDCSASSTRCWHAVLSGGPPRGAAVDDAGDQRRRHLSTTALLTRWLIAQGVSRWCGLVYPFSVGTLMSYSRDLTEPLACALAAGRRARLAVRAARRRHRAAGRSPPWHARRRRSSSPALGIAELSARPLAAGRGARRRPGADADLAVLPARALGVAPASTPLP